MVDLSEKADIIIKDYIEQGAYFTINRARQFGKTTMLSVLMRRLADRYLVIRLSFEGIDDNNFNDNNSFADMFCKECGKMAASDMSNPQIKTSPGSRKKV